MLWPDSHCDLQDSPEELGYVSDVCDYNVNEKLAGAGVVHGTLSLSLASENKAIKVDKTSNVVKPETTNPVEATSSNVFNIVKPFPSNKQSETDDHDRDSQLSRQSSVEDTKMDGKSKRKSSGGKSSAIKNKIQMRKMMKEANKMEGPSGVLSDGDHDNDHDSVEEKQDSELMVDDEIRNSNKTLRPQEVNTAQLTPETERRMKDWNSRFSNLKHSFDPPGASDREDDPSRSPSTQRHLEGVQEAESGSRGRSRFKERGTMGQRSQSAHTNLGHASRNTAPCIVIDRVEVAQSKDDKNKNNTMIARRGSSLTEAQSPKEKSPSIRRFEEETDDEYVQYMNSVDRYRQNNPNPKPFRPVTSRNDAIAAPLRKLSDVVPVSMSAPVPASAPAPVRGQIQQPQLPLQQPQLSPQQPQLPPQQPQLPPQQQTFHPVTGLQAKSKQTTPVREEGLGSLGARISRSVPKEVIRTVKPNQVKPPPPQKEESQAEILGLVKTNKETGQVEKTNDMDYEDYMNIIKKVRISKEHTRVRTEQARLASMYAQELKRQEEICLEEDRLQQEREKFEKEKWNPPVMSYKADNSLEKGQLDNIEQGEWSKTSHSSLNFKL